MGGREGERREMVEVRRGERSSMSEQHLRTVSPDLLRLTYRRSGITGQYGPCQIPKLPRRMGRRDTN